RDAEPRDDGLGEQRVASTTDGADRVVLEKPMRHHDVRPAQLAAAGDLVNEVAAAVDDELQVEHVDPDARVAVARPLFTRPGELGLEPPIAAADAVEHLGALRRVTVESAEDEDRVALELGERVRRDERANDALEQL